MNGAAGSKMDGRSSLRIVCVVSFLNEEEYLPTFLDSMAAQERFPGALLLVDDGSTDSSPEIASEFAAGRGNVHVWRRPRRRPERDRLAQAAELRSFQWALGHVRGQGDLIVKMDADLQLRPDLFLTLERTFLSNPELGIAGPHLSVRDPRTGSQVRERCPPQHVRGSTKFYRRACLEQISPIPAILGWDTIDELAARKCGWQTRSLDLPSGEVIHLRTTGSNDGMLRAHHRWGLCAYGIGQHPLWVALSATRRLGDRPRAIGSLAFLSGWASAAVLRRPRATPELRAFARGEELAYLRRRARCIIPI